MCRSYPIILPLGTISSVKGRYSSRLPLWFTVLFHNKIFLGYQKKIFFVRLQTYNLNEHFTRSLRNSRRTFHFQLISVVLFLNFAYALQNILQNTKQ